MKKIILGAAVAFLVIGTTPAFAKNSMGRNTFNAGVAFPSDTQATTTNPAALKYSMMELEIRGGSNTSFNLFAADGAFAGSSKYVGFGVSGGYYGIGGTGFGLVNGGLGFGTDMFAVGANVSFQTLTQTVGVNAGIQVGGKDGVGFGLTANGLTAGLTSITGGIGFRQPGSFLVELDGTYTITGGGLSLTPMIAAELSKLTFGLGMTFAVLPAFTANVQNGLVADLNYWVSDKFNIGANYNFGPSSINLAFKLAF